MSNIENRDISLKDIVDNISKSGYLIPKFQRDFVWNTKDIVDLGDSIIRGYPISSLLIMPENGSLKVGAHDLLKDDFRKFSNQRNENEVKHYILDGQQRITSISKLFLALDSKKEYYFDLLSILVAKYPSDHLQRDSGLDLSNRNSSKISDHFCRDFTIGKDKSEKTTRQNDRFILGKLVINGEYNSVISKFLLRTLKDVNDINIDKYNNYLGVILGAVSGYKIPSTVIASHSELGVVIRVFEKVNSTGKKLTLFDLINAKSFQSNHESYQTGLSDYLTNKIMSMVNQDESIRLGVYSFLKYNEDKNRFEKLDKIIRIFEIANLLKKGHTPSIFKSKMLEREPEFWFETWNENGPKLLEVISWMWEEGLVDIGQITFLEYALAIFIAHPNCFEERKFKAEIKKYTLYLTLSGIGFNKSNLEIVERLYVISKQISQDHESTKYNFVSLSSCPNLTGNQILEFVPSKMAFKAIMNIFYIEKIDGLFTVDIVGNSIGRDLHKTMLDNHHIYPKARVRNFSNNSKFNSIANTVLLDSKANREDIKDKNPQDYFSKIHSNTKGSFYCKQNLINIDAATRVTSEVEAETFIQDRAKNIATIVNSYFD